MPPPSPPRPRFVVCGDDPLAHSLVDELTNRYAAEVTVVLPSRRRGHGPQLASMSGVEIIEADPLDHDAFRAARLADADGLALVWQDDIGNLHAALRARELKPDVRLVIRVFHTSLGHGVRRLFTDSGVLSDAWIAAPELVAAALGEVAPSFVRLPGRTLYVARRSDVHPEEVVCGIATTNDTDPPDLLPADDRLANLVLAVANRPGRASSRNQAATATDAGRDRRRARRRARRRERRRRPVGALSRTLLSLVDSKLEIAVLALAVVFLGGVVAIGLIDGVSPWQALYTTLIIAADAGDPDLAVGLLRQVTQAAVAVAGIALVPVLTALVVSASVNTRLALAMGRLRAPMSGHVVVAGLGDLGTRVLWHLYDLGLDVVAIDQSERSRGAQLARELDIPLVVGDASREDTLRQASVRTCRALLALSTSDEVNLGAALHARAAQPELRVVLRLFDNDFARRVEQAFDIPISRSVSALAAPSFAAALLEREIIGTIAIRRRVLVIAEVPVAAGSELAGRPAVEVGQPGQVRLLALTSAAPGRIWSPAPDTTIRAGDTLLVIATRTGLSHILARTR